MGPGEGAGGRGRGGGQSGSRTCLAVPSIIDDRGTECPTCCQPQLALHKPALEDLLLGSNASLTCTLSGLKKSEGAVFSWTPSGGKEAIQKPPERDSCGCYSVSSVLPGCAEPWDRKETFSCTATHPEIKEPKTATIRKDSGGPRP